MGGGMAASAAAARHESYNGTVTPYILLTIVIAACGGLIFGYDIGVTGGVVSMHAFHFKFFPAIANAKDGSKSPWCKLDEPLLTLFTSSMYLAGAAASLVAFYPTRRFGRRFTMGLAGALFLSGAVLQAASQNLGMLIAGRVVLGVGIGFANQSVPVFLVEIAPYKWRGAVGLMFQMCLVLGELIAQLINYKTADYSKVAGGMGWRYSLGLAGIPALILFLGSFFLVDSPSSLAERGKLNQARAALEKIRGTAEVDAEYMDITEAANASALVSNPWVTILERRYRPQLILAIIVPMLQQLAGHLSILSYGPQIFGAIGNSESASLLSTIVTGVINVVCVGFMMLWVDWLGRRVAFIQSSVQMIVGMVATAVVLGIAIAQYDTAIPKAYADAALTTICIFLAAYSWGWGSLAWVYPQEIQSLATRAAGNSITTFTNMMTAFAMQQAFLSMLCTMQYGVWLFYAGFCGVGLVVGIWFLPETKGVPSERMNNVFAAHWFWRRFAVYNDLNMAAQLPLPEASRTLDLGDVPPLSDIKLAAAELAAAH